MMSTRNFDITTKPTLSLGVTPAADQIEAGNRGLTSAEVQFFQENGFVRLDAISTPQDIVEIRASLQDLFERRAGEKEGAHMDFIAGDRVDVPKTAPQIINPVNYCPKLRKTACFKNGLRIAQQLLGNEARCMSDLTILKKQRVGAGTPWHQDEAFRDPNFEYNEVTVWVALQDVTPEGGCLRFIPKSHKGEVLEHGPAGNDPTSQGLQCNGQFDADSSVSCPIPAGGCTIHSSRTLHGAGPNVSDNPRFAYIMIFSTPPRPLNQSRRFPWQQSNLTVAKALKVRWMRKGGILITGWRKLRRGDFNSWQTAAHGLKRIGRILRKGA
jgi:ectoine hydroxylase-related dioxygenase (phytanoyl-CoA dioxygenase family)